MKLAPVDIRFEVGGRRLCGVRRTVLTVNYSLSQLLSGVDLPQAFRTRD